MIAPLIFVEIIEDIRPEHGPIWLLSPPHSSFRAQCELTQKKKTSPSTAFQVCASLCLEPLPPSLQFLFQCFLTPQKCCLDKSASARIMWYMVDSIFTYICRLCTPSKSTTIYLPVIVVVMLSSSSSVFMGSFCDTRPTRILYVTQDSNAVVLHVTPVTPPLLAEHRYAISTHTLERLYAALGVFNVNEQRRRKAGASLR